MPDATDLRGKKVDLATGGLIDAPPRPKSELELFAERWTYEDIVRALKDDAKAPDLIAEAKGVTLRADAAGAEESRGE
jgi:hypothetical protein